MHYEIKITIAVQVLLWIVIVRGIMRAGENSGVDLSVWLFLA